MNLVGANVTTIGGSLVTWDRLRAIESNDTKWFWLILYTSSRRVIPGLWSGGVMTFADVVKFSMHQTISAIDDLLTHEMIEFDDKREVLRLTRFPDRTTRPHNGRHLRSLWTRFTGIVPCDVRNAHIRTLQWLLDDPEHPVTPDHVTVWEQTFATIKVPPKRRRGAKRLLDEDTSTPSQPSLFPTKQVDNVTNQTKLDTDPHTDRDQRSEIRDQISLPSGSGVGLPSTASALEDREGRANEEHGEPIPLLVSVPAMDDLPFTAAELMRELAAESKGRFCHAPLDGRLYQSLCATIRACADAQVGLPDLRVVGAWLGAGGLSYRSDLGPRWVCQPGALLEAVGLARAWDAGGRAAIGNGQTSRSPAQLARRADPAPFGAHGTGKRKL